MLDTWTTTSSHDDNDESEADASEEETDLPSLKLSSQKFGDLLRPSGATTTINQDDNHKTQTTASKLKASLSKRKPHLEEYIKSQQIGESVWETPISNTAAEDRQNPGHMYEDTFGDYLAALKNIKKLFLHATHRLTKKEMQRHPGSAMMHKQT